MDPETRDECKDDSTRLEGTCGVSVKNWRLHGLFEPSVMRKGSVRRTE